MVSYCSYRIFSYAISQRAKVIIPPIRVQDSHPPTKSTLGDFIVEI